MESIGRKVNKLLRRNKKKKNKRNNDKKQAKHDKDTKSKVLHDNDLFNSRGFPKSVGFIHKTSKEQKNNGMKVEQSSNLSNVQQASKDLDFTLHRRDSAQYQDEL